MQFGWDEYSPNSYGFNTTQPRIISIFYSVFALSSGGNITKVLVLFYFDPFTRPTNIDLNLINLMIFCSKYELISTTVNYIAVKSVFLR